MVIYWNMYINKFAAGTTLKAILLWKMNQALTDKNRDSCGIKSLNTSPDRLVRQHLHLSEFLVLNLVLLSMLSRFW